MRSQNDCTSSGASSLPWTGWDGNLRSEMQHPESEVDSQRHRLQHREIRLSNRALRNVLRRRDRD